MTRQHTQGIKLQINVHSDIFTDGKKTHTFFVVLLSVTTPEYEDQIDLCQMRYTVLVYLWLYVKCEHPF